MAKTNGGWIWRIFFNIMSLCVSIHVEQVRGEEPTWCPLNRFFFGNLDSVKENGWKIQPFSGKLPFTVSFTYAPPSPKRRKEKVLKKRHNLYSCHVMHLIFLRPKKSSSKIFKQTWIAMKCIEVLPFHAPRLWKKKVTKRIFETAKIRQSSPRQTLNGYLSAIFGVWFGDKDMCAMVHTIND